MVPHLLQNRADAFSSALQELQTRVLSAVPHSVQNFPEPGVPQLGQGEVFGGTEVMRERYNGEPRNPTLGPTINDVRQDDVRQNDVRCPEMI